MTRSAIPNRKNPQSEILSQQLRLFVYGTLKRGYWNHDRFCSQAVHIEPATTWGRLFHLPAGFPALEIPNGRILAHGTADPIADTQIQSSIELTENAMERPNGDWELIHGELMTFDNPCVDLPPIDRLEGFNPHGHCMYERVLMTVRSARLSLPVWLYHYALDHKGVRLVTGRWTGFDVG